MFRVRTEFLYDRPPQVDSSPLWGPAACVTQIYNSRINGRDFFECTYHPLAQIAALSLRSAPHSSDEAYERRASRQLRRTEGSVSETNGRAARSISCKPYGKLFPLIITLLCNVLLSQPSVSPGEIFNRVTRTLPVSQWGSSFSKMKNCNLSSCGLCVDGGWRSLF